MVAGADADVVHFSLEPDVTRLSDEGLVAEDWKDNATNGIATSSVVVFVIRAGNPEGIETWDDIVEPGIEIITPNPGSSGGARWNILAAWAHATGGTDDEAAGTEFLTKLLTNTIALPGSAREATTAFTDGSGDVLLSYENEAILAKQNGADIDYVVPPDTLLIENPAAVTTDASDAGEVVPGVHDQPRGAVGLRRLRSPAGRGRRRDPRGRGRQRPGGPVPDSRRRCSRSTRSSTAGARPTASTSATARRATPSASSPRSSRSSASRARSRPMSTALSGATIDTTGPASPQGRRPGRAKRSTPRNTLTPGAGLGLGIAMLWFSLLVLFPLSAIVAAAAAGRLGELLRRAPQRPDLGRASR